MKTSFSFVWEWLLKNATKILNRIKNGASKYFGGRPLNSAMRKTVLWNDLKTHTLCCWADSLGYYSNTGDASLPVAAWGLQPMQHCTKLSFEAF